MPLFIRSKKGIAKEVPETIPFVEIRSEDGKLAAVFLHTQDKVSVWTHKDPELQEYAHRFSLELADVVELTDPTDA